MKYFTDATNQMLYLLQIDSLPYIIGWLIWWLIMFGHICRNPWSLNRSLVIRLVLRRPGQ